MVNKNDQVPKIVRSTRCIGVVSSDANFRIKNIHHFKTNSRSTAMTFVEIILERGNCARLKNIANDFCVTELVLYEK